MMPAAATGGYALRTLCAGLDATVPDVRVTDLALDSRRVVPGGGFVALAGSAGHGLDYLDEALAAGAAVVLHAEHDPRWDAQTSARCRAGGATPVAVPSLSRYIGTMAARLWQEPAQQFDSIVAVTGTDGKTSVSHFIAAMLDEPDAPAAVLGTLGAGRPGGLGKAGLTTPDAFGLQRHLAELAGDGVRRLALEASSHGLAQYRLDGTRIDAAVLTQLGRDHLDYHADAAAYAAAKARLFVWPGLTAAVLNADDPFGRELAGSLAQGVDAITYGRVTGELRARQVAPELGGLRFDLCRADDAAAVTAPLIGGFNVDNLLAACGALLALGYSFAEVVERLGRVRAVPGRMEPFQAPGQPLVVVDYAHNAGALSAALAALRAHGAGRIWCIFGAGGERDRGKRALMGAAAAAAADRTIVTDDNPRHEDPEAIVNAILAGMPSGSAVRVERDRERALGLALSEAGRDDAILLAGKGHETGQTRGFETIAYSDRETARRLLGIDAETRP